MSSLNRGNYFKDRNNFFNALVAYNEALKKDNKKITGHFNSIGVYIELGLFYIALKESEIAVRNFEDGASDNLVPDYRLYSSRAWMKMEFELYESMNEDIHRCESLKKSPHLTTTIAKILYLLRSGKDVEIDSFVEETTLKYLSLDSLGYIAFEDIGDYGRFHFFLSKVFEVMGNFEQAIVQINSAIRINDTLLSYKYKLGELLFKSGNEFEANRIFDDLSRKSKKFLPYSFNQFEEGIITKTNRRGTKGTILTTSIFSGWDEIDFINTFPPNIKLEVGDLVSFKLDYYIVDGIRKGIAKNPKKTFSIHPRKLKSSTTFHCLINSTHNVNKNFNPTFFINVFYPEPFLFPFSMVVDKLSAENSELLNNKGFLFVEITFKIESSVVIVDQIKRISENNEFNFVDSPKPKKRMNSNRKSQSSGRICRVCQMDEWCGTDGCPMDPQ